MPDLSAEEALRLFTTPNRHPRPAWEAELLQRGERIRLPGGLAGVAWSAAANAAGQSTILLVHGWEGRGTQLGAFAAPLVAAGRRVIAFDGPGHGDSPDGPLNPVSLADVILAIGHELGPLDGVIAHSMGAASTGIALSHNLAARRVVLIAGPAVLQGGVDRFIAAAGLTPTTAAAFQRLLVERTAMPIEDASLLRLAPHLRTPALIFHDPADSEVPFADALALARVWPNARLREMPERGHRRILRDPDVICETAAFLTQP